MTAIRPERLAADQSVPEKTGPEIYAPNRGVPEKLGEVDQAAEILVLVARADLRLEPVGVATAGRCPMPGPDRVEVRRTADRDIGRYGRAVAIVVHTGWHEDRQLAAHCWP